MRRIRKKITSTCAYKKFNAEVELTSDRYAQLAIQGPRALETLQKLTATKLGEIRYYWFIDGAVSGVAARIARTGYTGEDGFENDVDPSAAARIWDEILQAGQEFGIKPCGLWRSEHVAAGVQDGAIRP